MFSLLFVLLALYFILASSRRFNLYLPSTVDCFVLFGFLPSNGDAVLYCFPSQ